MEYALCTPNNAWASADQAGVRSLNASFDDVLLPVEHWDGGNYTVLRSEYPDGVLIIPNGSAPSGLPLVLPVFVSDGSSQAVALEPANLLDFGVGGGVIFV